MRLFYLHWNGVWGRGCDETKISEENGFSLNGVQALSEWRHWQGILQERQFTEEVPAIQWIGGILKIEIFCAHPLPKSRAALKGTNLRGQTPICGFLRVSCGFSAVSCENQQFSAKICVSQMLCFLGKCENQQKSAKISENLRLGSVCPLRFVPLSAPLLKSRLLLQLRHFCLFFFAYGGATASKQIKFRDRGTVSKITKPIFPP